MFDPVNMHWEAELRVYLAASVTEPGLTIPDFAARLMKKYRGESKKFYHVKKENEEFVRRRLDPKNLRDSLFLKVRIKKTLNNRKLARQPTEGIAHDAPAGNELTHGVQVPQGVAGPSLLPDIDDETFVVPAPLPPPARGGSSFSGIPITRCCRGFWMTKLLSSPAPCHHQPAAVPVSRGIPITRCCRGFWMTKLLSSPAPCHHQPAASRGVPIARLARGYRYNSYKLYWRICPASGS